MVIAWIITIVYCVVALAAPALASVAMYFLAFLLSPAGAAAYLIATAILGPFGITSPSWVGILGPVSILVVWLVLVWGASPKDRRISNVAQFIGMWVLIIAASIPAYQSLSRSLSLAG